MSDFILVEDPPCPSHWLHRDGRHFISFYPSSDGPSYYQAYTSKAQPPKGRYPWAVDNRRLGRMGYGFPTLEAAMTACADEKVEGRAPFSDSVARSGCASTEGEV